MRLVLASLLLTLAAFPASAQFGFDDSLRVDFEIRMQETATTIGTEPGVAVRAYIAWEHAPGADSYIARGVGPLLGGQVGPRTYSLQPEFTTIPPSSAFPASTSAVLPGWFVYPLGEGVALASEPDDVARIRSMIQREFSASSYPWAVWAKGFGRFYTSVAEYPDTVSVGETFTLGLAVRNSRRAPLTSVVPAHPLRVLGDGRLRVVSGPSPASISFLPDSGTDPTGYADTLYYQMEAISPGPVTLDGVFYGDYDRLRPDLITSQRLCDTFPSFLCRTIVVEETDLSFSWHQTDIPSFRLTFTGPMQTADGTAITAWQWDFGDGVTGSSATEVHRYDEYGPVTVSLTVTDANGQQMLITRTVPVERFGVIVEDDGTIDLVPGPDGPLLLTADVLPPGFPPIVTVGSAVEGAGGRGVVTTGDPNVRFEGRPVSRIGDEVRAIQDFGDLVSGLYDTRGRITEGQPAVLVNGVPLPVVGSSLPTCCDSGPNSARLGDGLAEPEVMRMNAVPDGHTFPPTTQLNEVMNLLGIGPATVSEVTDPAIEGDTILEVSSNDGFTVGDGVLVVGSDGEGEVHTITGFGSLLLATPLAQDYRPGTKLVAVVPSAIGTATTPPPTEENVTLSVAPNPAGRATTATLWLAAPVTARVRVFDALGRIVARVHDGRLAAGTHRLALDLSPLSAGIYFLRLDGDAGSITRPFTVVR